MPIIADSFKQILLWKMLFFLCFFIFSSCHESPEKNLEEVKSLGMQWLNSHNGQGSPLEGFYAEHGHLVVMDGERFIGPEEIAGFYRSLAEENPILEDSHTILGIFEESRDFIYEMGEYQRQGTDQPWVYAAIWKRMVNGDYKRQFEVIAPRSPESDQGDWRQETDQQRDRLEEAYHGSNITGDYFTQDARYYWGGEIMVQGPQEILREMGQGGSEAFEPLLVYRVRDNLVFEIGEAQGLKYFLVWKKVNQQWLVHIDAYVE